MNYENLFIAYEGEEYDISDIITYLRGNASTGQVTDYKYYDTENGWVLLAKNVSHDGQRISDPQKEGTLLTVGDYSKKDMIFLENLLKYQSFTPANLLKTFANVSIVTYNTEYTDHAEGLTGLACGNKHLYYGFTPNKYEIILSNSKEAIEDLCENALELPSNSIIRGDRVYTIGKELPKVDFESIKKDVKTGLITAKKLATELKDKTLEASQGYLEKARDNYTLNEMMNAAKNLGSVKSEDYQFIDYLNAIFNNMNSITEEDIKSEHEMRLERKNKNQE